MEAGEVTWGLAGLPGYAALMECPLPGTVQRLSPVVSLALYTAPAWRQKVAWGGAQLAADLPAQAGLCPLWSDDQRWCLQAVAVYENA